MKNRYKKFYLYILKRKLLYIKLDEIEKLENKNAKKLVLRRY